MKRPNTCVNLIKAINQIDKSGDPVRLSRAMANVVVGQILPDGVVKGGSSLMFRYGGEFTRYTRDMDTARAWLRKQARGTQQTGILVTKVAARFKPLAVHILAQDEDNAVHWFLEDKTDIRSSNYLEDAATEIQVQGLELDYACVLWDADMRCEDGTWNFYKFNGKNKWNPENNKENQKYMLNAYRVLLTRARQGIIICIPKGNSRLTPEGFPEDPTRLPEFYDGTYKYLKSLGIKEI